MVACLSTFDNLSGHSFSFTFLTILKIFFIAIEMELGCYSVVLHVCKFPLGSESMDLSLDSPLHIS